MAITISWACETKQGPRPRNEDSVQVEPDLAAAVLADGMGGAAGGKEASSLAVTTAVEFIQAQIPVQAPADVVNEELKHLVTEVNRRVYEKSISDPGLHGMGSTLVVLLTRGERYYCANVGDSRAYHLRDGELQQISKDHSLVQERVDAGLISADEAAHQPDRNVLTRAIGTTPKVDPHIVEGDLLPEDVFVLTSDGVHGVVDRSQLATAGEAESAADAARMLVDAAIARGTRDNATAAVGRAAAAAPADSMEALDQVLSYSPTRDTTASKSHGLGGGTRWFLAGATLLLLATALAVLSLR